MKVRKTKARKTKAKLAVEAERAQVERSIVVAMECAFEELVRACAVRYDELRKSRIQEAVSQYRGAWAVAISLAYRGVLAAEPPTPTEWFSWALPAAEEIAAADRRREEEASHA